MGYPNYGMGAELANGIKEGLISYQTTKNMQRTQQLNDLLSGVQKNPDTGEFEYTPRKQQQMLAEDLATKHHMENYDPNSQVSKAKGLLYQQGSGHDIPEGLSGADIDETSKNMINPMFHAYGMLGQQGLKNQGALDTQGLKGQTAIDVAKIRASAMRPSIGLRQDALDERVHGQQVKAINNDPMLNQLQTSHGNLYNAVNLFQQGSATPQEFAELQQAVRANLGIKGSSGVSERAHTYAGTWHVNEDELKQWLTAKPQDVREGSPELSNLVVHLAHLEMSNKEKQADNRLKEVTQGRKSFYEKPENTGRAKDIEDTVKARKSSFQQMPEHPEDQQALEWATANKNDPRAQEILKLHGM